MTTGRFLCATALVGVLSIFSASAGAQTVNASSQPEAGPVANTQETQQPSSSATAGPATSAPAPTDIIVTGSRIARRQAEGAAPVTTISGAAIDKAGFRSVFDALTTLSQNTGFVQGEDYGSTFTPAANFLNLRGLGPNHSLALVNGRRLADYPVAYDGSVNAVNLANIPNAFVDSIEVLNGSAGAIYGSDAIAGVVNIKLKEKVEGLDLNLRAGDTQQGGGHNIRGQFIGGHSFGKLDVVFGGEISSRDPIFYGQRDIANSYSRYSTDDIPQIPPAMFSIRNPSTRTYYTPPAGACAALSGLQGGTIQQVASSSGGNYCGSDAYYNGRTIQTQKDSQSFYGHATYHLDDRTDFYASMLYTQSDIANLVRSLSWSNTFYNLTTSRLETWARVLTPEETGGRMGTASRYDEHAWNALAGVRGRIGDSWHWDLSYNRSQYRSVQSRDRLLTGITDYLLGPQNGSVSGFAAYNAPASRLYSPVPVGDFDRLSGQSITNARTALQDGSLAVNGSLFDLPGGPLAAAGTLEVGDNLFVNNADPLLNQGAYYGITSGLSSYGRRQRQAAAVELRAPIFKWLTLSGAGRYDRYEYGGNRIGAATYEGGIELRPTRTLLIRGSIASSFRAPDMNYVFEQQTQGYYPQQTDYYQCRLDKQPYSGCTDAYNINYVESGNKQLKPEHGQSLTAGFVWSPNRHFDISADYYRIRISDEVTSLDVDQLLRQEADCRLGQSISGSSVDANSTICQDYLSRVTRNPAAAVVNPNQVTLVRNNPINASSERTDGIDVSANMRWSIANIGNFTINAQYTRVFHHTYVQFPGDPSVDYLNDPEFQTDWKDRTTGTVTFKTGPVTLTGYVERYGRTANNALDGERSPYALVNLSGSVDITKRATLSLIVNNVADKYPVDKSGGWPYYTVGFYDIYGRQTWLQLNYHFG
ncbi:MAG: TonB-dependent receptor [Pseudomonadota bacterium]|nr:TonB-dependent receptor [Pseudomonadota bacterium]